jgi:hypothetical protein
MIFNFDFDPLVYWRHSGKQVVIKVYELIRQISSTHDENEAVADPENQWGDGDLSEGVTTIVEKQFLKPIRASITRIFSFLWRKDEKIKFPTGWWCAELSTGGSATGTRCMYEVSKVSSRFGYFFLKFAPLICVRCGIWLCIEWSEFQSDRLEKIWVVEPKYYVFHLVLLIWGCPTWLVPHCRFIHLRIRKIWFF